MFNTLIVCYLFLGGAGAGALTLLSVLELARASHRFGHMRPTAADQAMSKEFFARCWSICVVILIFGVLCLLVDLGHPERVLNLLISPTLTPIAIGAYSLAGALVCSGIFAAVELLDSFHPAIWAIRVLALLGIVLGLTASLYTGMLLQSMASVVFWNTPLLPALFLLSSLSTGIACLFLGTVFVEGRIAPFRPVVLLARIDVVLIVLEALCLVALLVTSAGNPDARAAFDALVSGEFRWAFWLGIIGCGLAAPFALEWFISKSNFRMQVLWVAAFVLIGGAVLRVCIVGAGAYDVTQASAALYGFSGAAGYEPSVVQ